MKKCFNYLFLHVMNMNKESDRVNFSRKVKALTAGRVTHKHALNQLTNMSLQDESSSMRIESKVDFSWHIQRYQVSKKSHVNEMRCMIKWYNNSYREEMRMKKTKRIKLDWIHFSLLIITNIKLKYKVWLWMVSTL